MTTEYNYEQGFLDILYLFRDKLSEGQAPQAQPEATKRCTKCGEVKPVSGFSRSKADRSGLQRWCKECVKAHYKAHQKEEAAKRRAYRNANLEKVLSREKAYREARTEEQIARSKAYSKAYRKAHREELASRKKAYYDTHREERIAYTKAYNKAHPDKRMDAHHRRRARKRSAPGSHTAADIIRQGDSQHWNCWWNGPHCEGYCKDKYHVDHRIPLCQGGSDGPENLVISCPTCNLEKGSKTPWEWLGRIL